ncbi:MAG: prolipoprotein diacylglyceryl transferase [Proteobacteria bacterium]|nr:prolipoprotein diacylglyceryl transferase [Pseudomonadota bacterium]
MLTYPSIDPVLLAVGPFQIRWYGLMYVIGFAAAYLLVRYQTKRFDWQQMQDQLDDLLLFLILGVVIGGRLGYVLCYNPAHYLAHPLEIPAIWTGGMSFHGGCLGTLLAGYLFCRRTGLDFWKGADLFIVAVPIGLFFGRLGNFINGELFGRITTVPWAMIFPEGGPLPRHPSQLYEASLEGLLLFAILWAVKAKPWQPALKDRWPHGSILALFLGLYGCLRFLVEFVREPDPQIGLIGSTLSMGQLLCLVMIVVAPMLWWWRHRATTKGGWR